MAATDRGSYEERECSRCFDGCEYDPERGAWVECRTCSGSGRTPPSPVGFRYPSPMPLEQPRRHNPLMLGYFEQIGMTSADLARRCEVARSQVMMARTRNVGANNGEKIASGIASLLGLSEEQRLELLAEIRGHGNPALAYFGTVDEASRCLGVERAIARKFLRGHPVGPVAARRMLAKLREMDAPEPVMASLQIQPRPPGQRTHGIKGDEMSRQRRETRESLSKTKPHTARAIEDSGLSHRQLYERAGVGKETLRKALYEPNVTPTPRTVEGIVSALGLFGDEAEAVRAELFS